MEVSKRKWVEDLKQFSSADYAALYLQDIRMKIPGYDLVLEILEKAIFPCELKQIPVQNSLLIGGNTPEIDLVNRNFPNSQIAIVDASSAMIEAMQPLYPDAKFRFTVAPFEEFNSTQSYQLSLCLLVIHFVTDKKAFLDKIYRELAADGVLILSLFSSYHLDWWEEFALASGADEGPIRATMENLASYMSTCLAPELENLLKDCGFRRIEKISQILPIEVWFVQK